MEKGYNLHCDLPGCSAGDLDVSIDDGCMKLKAERRHVHAADTDQVHMMERSFGQVRVWPAWKCVLRVEFL